MTQRRGLRAGLVALFMAGSFGAAKADDAASAKKAIQAMYTKVEAAAEKRDLKGMMVHLAPDYKETGPDGVTEKLPAIRAKIERLMQSVKSIRVSASIDKLTLKGNEATVIGKSVITLIGFNQRAHKDIKIVVEETNEEQWKKKDGLWLESSVKSISYKQTIDGKENPFAKVDAVATAKKAIQALHAKSAAAAEKKDVQGMLAHVAPDYEEGEQDETATKLPYIRSLLERTISKTKSVRMGTVITKFTLNGDKATVLTATTFTVVADNPRTKKEEKFAMQGTSEEQWEKKSGVWLEKRTKMLTAKETVDGKDASALDKQRRKGEL